MSKDYSHKTHARPNLQEPWIEIEQAAARIESAKAYIRLLLSSAPKIGRPEHLRELLSTLIWKITEANGKWDTRYCSESLFRNPDCKWNHEHVYGRKQLIDELLDAPKNLDAIMKNAIGCVVSEAEHKLLTKISRTKPGVQGWKRYISAKITVIDRKTGRPLQ